MPRLRSRITGSVVNVSDDLAARLGAAYEPVKAKAADQPAKAAPKKAASTTE